MTIVLNGADARVLGALSDGSGDYFEYLRVVAERLGMEHREVRVRCRRLVRKGFARIEHLFDDSSGLTAGSTYVTTDAGRRGLTTYRALFNQVAGTEPPDIQQEAPPVSATGEDR